MTIFSLQKSKLTTLAVCLAISILKLNSAFATATDDIALTLEETNSIVEKEIQDYFRNSQITIQLTPESKYSISKINLVLPSLKYGGGTVWGGVAGFGVYQANGRYPGQRSFLLPEVRREYWNFQDELVTTIARFRAIADDAQRGRLERWAARRKIGLVTRFNPELAVFADDALIAALREQAGVVFETRMPGFRYAAMAARAAEGAEVRLPIAATRRAQDNLIRDVLGHQLIDGLIAWSERTPPESIPILNAEWGEAGRLRDLFTHAQRVGSAESGRDLVVGLNPERFSQYTRNHLIGGSAFGLEADRSDFLATVHGREVPDRRPGRHFPIDDVLNYLFHDEWGPDPWSRTSAGEPFRAIQSELLELTPRREGAQAILSRTLSAETGSAREQALGAMLRRYAQYAEHAGLQHPALLVSEGHPITTRIAKEVAEELSDLTRFAKFRRGFSAAGKRLASDLLHVEVALSVAVGWYLFITALEHNGSTPEGYQHMVNDSVHEPYIPWNDHKGRRVRASFIANVRKHVERDCIPGKECVVSYPIYADMLGTVAKNYRPGSMTVEEFDGSGR